MAERARTIEELKRVTDTPVVIADHRGRVAYVNAEFQAAFGWTPPALVGQPLLAIIPPHLHDAHTLGFSRFLTAGEASGVLNRPLRLKIMTQDGRELDAEHFIIAEKLDGRWTFGATVRPVTLE